jgi:hypothetical protein
MGIKADKKRFVNFFLLILIIINFLIIIYFFYRTKITLFSSKAYSVKETSLNKSDLYNKKCPDLILYDIGGKSYVLSDLIGNVLVIRFTNFLYHEVPDLVYLDHLSGKFREDDLKVFLACPSVKMNMDFQGRYIDTSIPIIHADNSIISVFNADLNDIIIIDKELRIKLKNNNIQNRSIFNILKRYLGYENETKNTIPEFQIGELIKKLPYLNIANSNIEIVGDIIKGKSAFVNLIISNCLGCPESRKITEIKKALSILGDKNHITFFLFGKGNNAAFVEEFSVRNKLYSPDVRIGIIQPTYEISDTEYYSLFEYNLIHRISLYNEKGELNFLESLENQHNIDADFIIEKLK